MLKFTAFTTRKPRQFEYRPRFYDPDKEAREERRRELFGADAAEDIKGEYKPGQYIKRQQLNRQAHPPKRRTEDKIARIIRFTVMGMLALIVLIFFLKL